MKKLILSIIVAQCGLIASAVASEKTSCNTKAVFSINVKPAQNMSRHGQDSEVEAAACCSWGENIPGCMKGC